MVIPPILEGRRTLDRAVLGHENLYHPGLFPQGVQGLLRWLMGHAESLAYVLPLRLASSRCGDRGRIGGRTLGVFEEVEGQVELRLHS
jgi:hypothetical protein